MWNNVVKIAKQNSTKRLALAMLISVIVHTYLVGGIPIRLPNLTEEPHQIEARLQMPAVVKKPAPPIAVKPIEEKPLPVANKKAFHDAITEPPTASSQITETESKIVPIIEALEDDSALVTESNSSVTFSSAPTTEVMDLESVSQEPIETNQMINEAAYQYVETDFDVRTQIDGVTEGMASIVFNVGDDKQYRLTSVMKPKGFAALFVSELLQTSEGALTTSGLQPLKYRYQYGDKADKTYIAEFDWPANTVRLTTSKGSKLEPLSEGTQDLLSFMYQFMYVAPLQSMQINIATGKKLSRYNYSFSGEEDIQTALGNIKTFHIMHESESTDEKTELWLALDYQYLPVKIRKTEKNGKVYELVANRINTARPTLN